MTMIGTEYRVAATAESRGSSFLRSFIPSSIHPSIREVPVLSLALEVGYPHMLLYCLRELNLELACSIGYLGSAVDLG